MKMLASNLRQSKSLNGITVNIINVNNRCFLNHIKKTYLKNEFDMKVFPSEDSILDSKENLFKYPIKEN